MLMISQRPHLDQENREHKNPQNVQNFGWIYGFAGILCQWNDEIAKDEKW